MAKKSYDQRLKERWARKQRERQPIPTLKDTFKFRDMASWAYILPFLFGRGGLR